MSQLVVRCGWGDATATPLAGDASARRYTRLTKGGARAILMQDPEGDVALFARLSRHLIGLGLSAPHILGEDAAAGELLLEDLGDGLIARLADTPKTEEQLYRVATDVLVALHRHAPPDGLPKATPSRLAAMTDLAFDCYAGYATGNAQPEAKAAVCAAFGPILAEHAQPADVMMLRDYHAENILWLPERTGPARAGLLDFQDAMQAHRAYDLVSLLQDARRDVSPKTTQACIAHYLDQTDQNEADFRTAYAVLGAQRNLRILGVFARLARTRGKPNYIDLIPRVWGHLQTDLAHPVLAPIREALADLPAPTGDILQRLKSPCPTR